LSVTTSSASGVVASPARAWRALGVLLIGMFMSLLDATIVNVALPTIRTSLNASEATLSWIISGYALAFGLALIPAGRVGDRYGHKWVFITGLLRAPCQSTGEQEGTAEAIKGRGPPPVSPPAPMGAH
jgi:fucose permease